MRANQEIITEYMQSKRSFVWIAYLSIPDIRHTIKASFIDWEKLGSQLPNKLNLILDTYPNFTLLETFIHEDLDFIEETFGIPKTYIWDDYNQNYRHFMMFFKDGEFIKHSIEECFCLDTLFENVSNIIPELLEPTSVG